MSLLAAVPAALSFTPTRRFLPRNRLNAGARVSRMSIAASWDDGEVVLGTAVGIDPADVVRAQCRARDLDRGRAFVRGAVRRDRASGDAALQMPSDAAPASACAKGKLEACDNPFSS